MLFDRSACGSSDVEIRSAVCHCTVGHGLSSLRNLSFSTRQPFQILLPMGVQQRLQEQVSRAQPCVFGVVEAGTMLRCTHRCHGGDRSMLNN